MDTEKAIEELLSKMTLHEKVVCCHATTKFSAGGVERLGIPAISMSDGPHGVREEICADSWDAVGGDADYSTYLPPASALASTWNRQCAAKFGTVLGSEARERRKDIILGPGINIVRTPLCGRNFEYFSEDPLLAGKLSSVEIRNIQENGTAACVKHFALNSQEMCRTTVDARCDERTLREIYLPAFEMAVKEGGALTLMGAYNRYNGQYCCQNDRLLNGVLKGDWGFQYAVVSDWNGVHDTLEAARGGMEIEMGTYRPWNEYYLADDFEKALQEGSIDVAVVDDKVRRILRVMFELGLLGDKVRPAGERNTPRNCRYAQEIAEEAAVLLKNDHQLLPLDKSKLKKLLVVGDNATRKHHYGGQSSAIKCRYEVTPLEGLKGLLKDTGVEIQYFRGYPSSSAGGERIPNELMGLTDEGAGTRGWLCKIYDNHWRKGEPVCVLPMTSPEFNPEMLPESLKGKDYGVLLEGYLTPKETADWTFYLQGNSQCCLAVPPVNWIEICKSEDDVTGSVVRTLQAGETYHLMIPIRIYVDLPVFPVKLTAEIRAVGQASNRADNAALLKVAEEADAVLFFGGLSHTYDSEGSDRKDLRLPDGQNELIEALAEVNQKLAVVMVGGSPVEMPWIDQVPAIMQMWYAGQEGGHAIARILFGDVNPSGKLPVTFPKSYGDTPTGRNGDYQEEVCNYKEGVLVGYRHYDYFGIEPLFPFGHGLSYTTFEVSEPTLVSQNEDGNLTCSCKVTNTGNRSGKCVVQLYVEAPKTAEVIRPIRELREFAKTSELAPGATETLTFELTPRAWQYFHPVTRQWTRTPGEYRLHFAFSSREMQKSLDIRF